MLQSAVMSTNLDSIKVDDASISSRIEYEKVDVLMSFKLDQVAKLDYIEYESSEADTSKLLENFARSSSCLAIDCNLESYSSLSSSSSCSSTDSSSVNEQQKLQPSLINHTTQLNEDEKPGELEGEEITTPLSASNCSTLLLVEKKKHPHVVNKKLNSIKSSGRNSSLHHLSNEFLSSNSGDEGYVGSYSEKNMAINKPSKERNNEEVGSTNELTNEAIFNVLLSQLNNYLSPQDQMNLLNHLLDLDRNTHQQKVDSDSDKADKTHTVKSIPQFDVDTLNELDEFGCSSVFGDDCNELMTTQIKPNNNNDEDEILIEIPNLFQTISNDDDEVIGHMGKFFVDQLSFEQDDSVDLMSNETTANACCNYCLTDLDLNDQLDYDDTCLANIWHGDNELLNGNEKRSKCLFASSSDKLNELCKEINEKRLKMKQQDELDMWSTVNWRFVVQKQALNDKKTKELKHEDNLDLNAYLNEIEMNLDHGSYDTVYLSTYDVNSEYYDIDTMLKFKTNYIALNLRRYHKSLMMQRQQVEANSTTATFANIQVDAIQEFKPIDYSSKVGKDYFDSGENVDAVESDFHDYETATADIILSEENANDLTLFPLEATVTSHYSKNYNQLEENEFDNDEQDHNINNFLDETIKNSQMYEHMMMVDEDGNNVNYEEYYFNTEQEYEDYEDQLYIDGLSEQEALELLRNESELYAMQMAQAAKSGIVINDNANPNILVDECNANQTEADQFAVSSVDSQDVIETSSNTEVQSTNDIFENVFNYYNEVEVEIDEMKNCFYYYNNNNNSENCTSSGSVDETPNGQISLSLRNSLVKLRQSRRHLAYLIEENNQKLKTSSSSSSATSSTTASSTTSSLTTTSNMSLYKQQMLNGRKPCVYMLNEGRCARADCRFVHDLKSITCKYWLEGECLKGDTCEFLHEHVVQPSHHKTSSSGHNHRSGKNANKSSNEASKKKKDFKLDSEEFPALGGSATTASANNTSITSPISFVSLTNSSDNNNNSKADSGSFTPNKDITISCIIQQQLGNTLKKSPGDSKKEKNSIANIVKQSMKTAASVLLSNIDSTSTKTTNMSVKQNQKPISLTLTAASSVNSETTSHKAANKSNEGKVNKQTKANATPINTQQINKKQQQQQQQQQQKQTITNSNTSVTSTSTTTKALKTNAKPVITPVTTQTTSTLTQQTKSSKKKQKSAQEKLLSTNNSCSSSNSSLNSINTTNITTTTTTTTSKSRANSIIRK